MLHVLSKKESRERRREGFLKLKPGSLFDLGQLRDFIAVEKVGPKKWKVIELTPENRKKIIAGEPISSTFLHYNQMDYLNVTDEEYRAWKQGELRKHVRSS